MIIKSSSEESIKKTTSSFFSKYPCLYSNQNAYYVCIWIKNQWTPIYINSNYISCLSRASSVPGPNLIARSIWKSLNKTRGETAPDPKDSRFPLSANRNWILNPWARRVSSWTRVGHLQQLPTSITLDHVLMVPPGNGPIMITDCQAIRGRITCCKGSRATVVHRFASSSIYDNVKRYPYLIQLVTSVWLTNGRRLPILPFAYPYLSPGRGWNVGSRRKIFQGRRKKKMASP